MNKYCCLLAAPVIVLACAVLAIPADDETTATVATFPPTKGRYHVMVLRVIDGDTLEVGHITPQRIRIQGIQAPELNSDEGKKAKDYLLSILPEGTMTTVQLSGKKSFERVIGDVQCKDGFWAAKMMLESKHARRYP